MKVRLCSGWDYIPTQLVFGELAKLASKTLIHYHSDLYHDAHWLDDNLQVGVPFYYGVRDIGTDIWLVGALGHESSLQIYRCELTLENGTHYLTMEEAN